MIAYKCDICKEEITGTDYLEMKVTLHKKIGVYVPEEKCKEGHVCGVCMEKVATFIGSLKE